MNPRLVLRQTLLAACAALPMAAAIAASDDAAMLKLATGSGCMSCHHVERDGKGPDGLPPIGPAWRDVSIKYRGQTGAEERLTATVLAGSNPYDSHWKGQASGLAMPPNRVAISEGDARRLVHWIVGLEAGK